jgi:SAM-dependent methyltransferase
VASDAPELAAGPSRLADPGGVAEPPEPPYGRSPLLWSGLRHIVREHQQQGRPAPRVLDCGGGSGSLAVPLAAAGAVVTVVDVSVDALATLTRRAAEAGVSDRVSAVQGDAELLADLVPADDFDLVLAHDVLEDVASPVSVLRQIAGVLRPGGVLSVVAANPVAGVLARALAGDLAGALAALSQPGATVEVLSAQCLAAGLEVQSVEGLGVFSDLVPGIELDRPGALATLAELESRVGDRPPYRDIASRLHLQARRPAG